MFRMYGTFLLPIATAGTVQATVVSLEDSYALASKSA